MTLDCIGIGLLTVDHLLTMEQYPASNSKNVVKSYAMHGGGPVPTALTVLGNFGKKCIVQSRVGADAMADFLAEELSDYNVSDKGLIRDDSVLTPESFIIIDERNGDRTIMLNQNGNARIFPQDVNEKWIKKAGILHLDGRDQKTAIAAAQIARQHNTLVSIDIGSNRPVSDELLKLTDIAIVSEDFTNAKFEKKSLKSAQELLNYGMQIAAVTCGEDGSYWASSQECFHQPAFPVNVVDTTGAGDVFHGAALLGILEKYTLKETAAFASAVSAFVCCHVGGKAGMPNRDQVDAFLQNKNIDTNFLIRRT